MIDVPGASATDTEFRVALRLVKLLKELGFFANEEARPGENDSIHASIHVAVLGQAP